MIRWYEMAGEMIIMGNVFKWDGPYGPQGKGSKKLAGGNTKGVMRQVRQTKREEAETRNAQTSPERRRALARRLGYKRISEAIRAGVDVGNYYTSD